MFVIFFGDRPDVELWQHVDTGVLPNVIKEGVQRR